MHHAGADVTYLIGGSTRRGDGYHYFDDVWAWNGKGWSEDAPLPFPRSSHRVVYHENRNTLLLFGGGFGTAVRAEGVLWEFRDRQWTAIGGHAAAGRSEPGVCYDRARDAVVIFGGWDRANAYRGDTWAWKGTDLAQVSEAGPEPRAGHIFVFDPARQRCLLFGGQGESGFLSDTWEWDGTAWQRLATSGSPSPRWFAGAAADPEHKRIVLFGGRDGARDLGDTWTWNGERWEPVAATGPAPRMGVTLAFTGHAIVLFGGRSAAESGFVDHDDTWELRGGKWRRQRSDVEPVSPGRAHFSRR